TTGPSSPCPGSDHGRSDGSPVRSQVAGSRSRHGRNPGGRVGICGRHRATRRTRSSRGISQSVGNEDYSEPERTHRLLGGDLDGDRVSDAVLVLQVPTGYRIYGVSWDPDPPDTVQGVYDTTAMRQWGGALSGGFTFDATRHLVGDVTGNGYDDVVTIRR
ncbi:MAG TPA: hypothetical protein VHI11_14555, partial [Jiangellaceae bacterium]|nr:hypothetical protein [Jiangellaceae bacterium]